MTPSTHHPRLALARPADWEVLGRVWKGVQDELGWPAPGIAVSGTDACQLWFSLADPLPPAQAHALLERLRLRYLHGGVGSGLLSVER